jgi:FkbM family methyltransferase
MNKSHSVRRVGVTADGTFQAYVPGESWRDLFGLQNFAVDPLHEQFVQDWLGPDDVVWDIGAGFGAFAFPAALKVKQGNVHAFEANAQLAQQLKRSLSLPCNKGLKLRVADLSISDRDSTGLAGAGFYARSPVRETGKIDTLSASIGAPTAIRLNVSGAEAQILDGARATIAKSKPSLLLESVRDPQALAWFFNDLDYVMLDGSGDRGRPLQQPALHTLAIPPEKYEASPLASLHKVLGTSPKRAHSPASSAGSILVADDDKGVQQTCKVVLERAGYKVRVAGNGADAVTTVSSQDVSVALLDIFMPEMDGIETLLKLKRQSPATSVIVMSGGGPQSRFDLLETATRLGAKGWLKKPFTTDQLLAALI